MSLLKALRPLHSGLRLHTVIHVRQPPQDITFGTGRVSTRGVRQSGPHLYIYSYINIYINRYIRRGFPAVPLSDRLFANRHMRADVCDIEAMSTYVFVRPGTGNRLLLISCSARAAKGHEGGSDSSVLTFPGACHQGEFTPMVTSIAPNSPRGPSRGSPRLDVH